MKRAGARLYAPRGPGGVVDRGKRVLLLLPTTTYRAHDFIRAAGRLGVETVVGSDRKQALQDLQPTRGVTLELRDPEKAAGQIAHEGGPRFATSSDEYRILRDWIAQGMKLDPPGAPILQSLTVMPVEFKSER